MLPLGGFPLASEGEMMLVGDALRIATAAGAHQMLVLQDNPTLWIPIIVLAGY